MLKQTLKRSFRTLQPVQVFSKRQITGASRNIPNPRLYKIPNQTKTNTELWNELKQLKSSIATLQNATAQKPHNFESNAVSSISNEEVQRLEQKIEVSKTDNSYENRKLGTELKEMEIKYSDRMDGMAREIQLQRVEFHAMVNTWTSDLLKQVDGLHSSVRLRDGGVVGGKGGSVAVGGKEAKEAKEVKEVTEAKEAKTKTESTMEEPTPKLSDDQIAELFFACLWKEIKGATEKEETQEEKPKDLERGLSISNMISIFNIILITTTLIITISIVISISKSNRESKRILEKHS